MNADERGCREGWPTAVNGVTSAEGVCHPELVSGSLWVETTDKRRCREGWSAATEICYRGGWGHRDELAYRGFWAGESAGFAQIYRKICEFYTLFCIK